MTDIGNILNEINSATSNFDTSTNKIRQYKCSKVSNVGIYFLMIYFGAAFGNTVMARFSLLYGRFDDIYTYSGVKYFYASQLILVAMVIYFIVHGFMAGGKKDASGEEAA